MKRPLPNADTARAPRGLALLAAALLCLSLDARAQEGAPQQQKPAEPAPVGEVIDDDEVLRVDSNLVTIPATVTETTGRPVADLRLQDFELRVDGQPKPISDLGRADTPLVLAVLFDNSSSLSTAREFEKQAAVRFFQRIVRPIDKASVYSISTVPVLARPLTSNVQVLVRSIQQFPEPEGATALFDTISQAAGYLSPFDARKVIVIVSDGNDTISEASFDQALQRALKTGCQIYVVGTGDIENQNLTDTIARKRLQVLSAQTGGALYIPRSVEDLDSAFEQISNDISQQYVLSYVPEDDPADGRFRAIDLRVRDKPTLRVRAREGYYAKQSGQSAASQPSNARPPTRTPANALSQTAAPPSGDAGVSGATARVRPRRAGGASSNNAASAPAKETAPQVASLDPLYTTTPETLVPARKDVPSGTEIAIKLKPTAARPSKQTGPQEHADTPEPEVSNSPAEEPTPRQPPTAEPAPERTLTAEPEPAAPTPTPAPSYVPTSAPASTVNKTKEPEPAPTPQAKEAPREPVSGGVLNGKATSLPKPVYPSNAKTVGARGTVTVEVEIDESGRVVTAKAVSGHPMLQNAAVVAARQARFSPTLLSGLPVRVQGTIIYNFIGQ